MTQRRHAIAALALAAASLACPAAPPALSVGGEGAGTPDGVCGVWQMGGDGAVFAVAEDSRSDCYTLTIVDSPDYSVLPGTPFGTMRHTGTTHRFDAQLLTTPAGSPRKSSRLDYIIEFSPADGTLTFRHYSRGWAVNMLRALPYLFRISVRRNDSRPEGIDAAHRLGADTTPNHITI